MYVHNLTHLFERESYSHTLVTHKSHVHILWILSSYRKITWIQNGVCVCGEYHHSGPRLHLLSAQFCLHFVLLLGVILQYADVTEIPEVLVVIQSIAHQKCIRHLKTNVVWSVP